ncbi:MAG: Clp protease ClpP [Bacteroidales bacterium]|nr:Clp protease ClpP [Bacteroidales bacterium]
MNTTAIFNISKPTADEGLIEIYGPIGSDYWDGVSIQSFQQQIAELADCRHILVRISSFGGDVNQALGIYELLRSFGDRVSTECIGLCASAATIIAMAGHCRRMSRFGMMLIHKCSSDAFGNENDLEEALETQRKINAALVKLYAERTGQAEATISDLMAANAGQGRWLDCDEALALGLITETIADLPALKDFARGVVKSLTKPTSTMYKPITNLAPLAELLEREQLPYTEEGYLLDEEQLRVIANQLHHMQAAIDDLRTSLTAAHDTLEAVSAERDTSVTMQAAAEARAEAAEKKAAELQAMLDTMPAPAPAPSSDTAARTDWQAEYEASAIYNEALLKMRK